MSTQKYIVRHPNFDEYLKKLDNPITAYNDDMGADSTIHAHVWLSDKPLATKFDTELEARENYTSPLCETITL